MNSSSKFYCFCFSKKTTTPSHIAENYNTIHRRVSKKGRVIISSQIWKGQITPGQYLLLNLNGKPQMSHPELALSPLPPLVSRVRLTPWVHLRKFEGCGIRRRKPLIPKLKTWAVRVNRMWFKTML